MNINKTIEFVGSSYSSTEYGGAGLFVGTPDNTNSNKSSISKIVWKNVYQYTSSDSKLAGSGNVEIPAGKQLQYYFTHHLIYIPEQKLVKVCSQVMCTPMVNLFSGEFITYVAIFSPQDLRWT